MTFGARTIRAFWAAGVWTLVIVAFPALAAAQDELTLVAQGKSQAVIGVSAEKETWERKAADELARCIELMSGAKLAIADSPEAIQKAQQGPQPVILIGRAALAADPTLGPAIAAAAKKNPVLRSDAIGLRRKGKLVLVAGNHDEAHYYAVAELLRRWGCRWYVPTEFGECLPDAPTLKLGPLDYVYGSPFEVRKYWISWVGDTSGAREFQLHNYMNQESVPNGHILGSYVKDLVPPGKSVFNVPITADKTADHVAGQVEKIFAEGKHVQLGIEDGLYQSDDPLDKELIALQYDKYFLTPSYTDAFLTFYNKVAQRLQAKHPRSPAKIGFLAYANLTLPPVRVAKSERSLVAYLAPIDIDPIHSMDDPRSPPKQEYRDMLYKWAKVMEGRVVIYDYDQGMLVWRDVPNPSHQAFRHDVRHYQKAGILGIDTESRNAIGTTFLNLFFRGQLLWNPEADVDALLTEFYPAFYGPAAEPMSKYWTAIYQAWENTICTEHEFFLLPAVYTDDLVKSLGTHLAAAEAALAPLRGKANPSRNEKLFLERMKFTRLSYEMIRGATDVARLAARDANFAAAAARGKQALATREQLTDLSGIFTTYRKYPEGGPAWWPGEVQYYEKLSKLVDGPEGKLIQKLPLEAAFRRDAKKVGLAEKWHTAPLDLAWWKARPDQGKMSAHLENPGHWAMVSTGLYLQAQGVLGDDRQAELGQGWYRLDLELKPDQVAGKVHLLFPGLFNPCALYVNGQQVAERKQHPLWWMNDYEYRWDVDLSGKLKPGVNTVALRIENPHHFAGIFRRPLLYRAEK